MDSSSFEGLVLDPSKCSKLSVKEKREIVYELAKWSHGAPEMLQTWTRQDILQILCAEMGKERKYTGLTKLRIIENLLKIVSEKSSHANERNENENNPDTDSSPSGQRATKRLRKNEHPTRVTIEPTNILPDKGDLEVLNTTYCKNLACKAKLTLKDRFCKRCSCCICRKYDDNKDPSLWLTCSSDPPYFGDSCGLSCHLECALKNGKSGIARNGMDGNFFCVSCGKLNDLLGCWRKQLIIAKETRRVDILCYRISMSQKLLSGTKRYQEPYRIVDEAKDKLEDDVGPLNGHPVKMSRGIVNRLSSGPEVQSLCGLALESLDSVLSRDGSSSFGHFVQEPNAIPSNIIRLEDITSSSATVILGSKDSHLENILCYTLWHRKNEDVNFPEEPTCTLMNQLSSYLISDLTPATDYVIKVIACEGTREIGIFQLYLKTSTIENEIITNANNMIVVYSLSPTTISSSLSNPSSVEDETNNVAPENEKEKINDGICRIGNLVDSNNSLFVEEGKGGELICFDDLNVENKELPLGETSNDIGSNTRNKKSTDCNDIPITPYKSENMKGKPKKKDLDNSKEPQDGSSSKKRERRDEETMGNANNDFEYYVKVIRWLECEGHIEMNFRQKFLTWYSLRATPQEVRVVKVFVDTLIEDPSSLAGQLVDAFSDAISSKRSLDVPSGFCMKLWH